MNRNVNSRFAYSPTVNIGRSKFDMNHSLKTSWNVGELIPIMFEEVLPGDTMQLDTSALVRMQTMVAPIMDNIYLDTYYFFVPNRLVWSHWKNFMGESTTAWLDNIEYTIPQLNCPDGGWQVGTLADYFGIPTGIDNISVNALPLRAYGLIANEFFRSEVVTDPLNVPVGDAVTQGSNGDNYINDCVAGGKPFKAAKFFDLFTGATIAPQKGPDVMIGFEGSATVPVTGNGYPLSFTQSSSGDPYTLIYTSGTPASLGISGDIGHKVDIDYVPSPLPSSGNRLLGVPTIQQLESGIGPSRSGLVAQIGEQGMITINALRTAFQIQKFYEKQALYGSRYTEIVRSMFGVVSPDARLQRPEYLGGHRINININQVVQTSASDDTTPQGNTAAYSLTADSHSDFTHSFTEHGMVIGLAVARYDHTYQQGLRRSWSRETKLDYYFPVFANLSNQAIKNKEIYMQNGAQVNPSTGKPYNEEVFGYQEAWYDYRYHPNMVTGEMRSQYDTSLDVWHLGDYYESLPHLSDEWIREDKSVVDRALAVTSSVSNQMFGDFFFKCTMTRPMPLYSIPGLIDHH